MPANRNALVRYKTIDNCLRNRQRLWSLNDLIDACSDALYEYEGIDKGVSKRTIQADIQLMRSDKLGYNAPIIVIKKKYYTYEDASYSITNLPITEQDLERLHETVSFLKQFQGFSHFKDLDSMVQKLEDHVYAQKTNHTPVIDFEKNENLRGLEYLDQLYQAIVKQNLLRISYQSFRARTSTTFEFKPMLLKEFRNRWFLIGYQEGHQQVFNLALDRIESVQATEKYFYVKNPFDAQEYFKHTIGVTVNNLPPDNVILYILHRHAPYVLTKPLHWSQKEIARDNYGVTISLDVQYNFELEKEILGLGEYVKVISPRRLRDNIKERLKDAIDFYDTELSQSGLVRVYKQLEHKGHSILNHVYTKRELKRIKKELDKFLPKHDLRVDDFIKNQQIMSYLLNDNLLKILSIYSNELNLISVHYYGNSSFEPSYNHWYQSGSGNNPITIRIYIDDTVNEVDKLRVIQGSHKARLNDKQIITISQNATPYISDINSGGIHIINPLIIQYIPKHQTFKKRRVIELEYGHNRSTKD